MRASQNHLPQSFEASHRPQQPQYFLVVMSGRRNSYVELDSAKKLKILAPYWGVISYGQVDLKQMLSCFIMPSGTYIFISISRRLQCLHLSNELKTALD